MAKKTKRHGFPLSPVRPGLFDIICTHPRTASVWSRFSAGCGRAVHAEGKHFGEDQDMEKHHMVLGLECLLMPNKSLVE